MRNPYDNGRDYGRDNRSDNNWCDNNWRDNNWRDNNWRDNNGCDNNERENNGRDRNGEMTRRDHGDNAASTVYARQPERRGGKEADTDDVVVDSDVIDAADKDAVDIVDKVDNSRVAGMKKATTEDVNSTDSSETRLTNHVNETIVSVYMHSSPSTSIVSNTFCSDKSRSYSTC